MQALVEHCVAAGRPEDVERCVLKMDLLSLDLNQVRLPPTVNGVHDQLGRLLVRCAAGPARRAVAGVPEAAEPGGGGPGPAWRATVRQPLSLPPPLPQLIPLCIRHRLFAALVHIFTRALLDHQTPAALLLVASAAAAEAEAAAAAVAVAAYGAGGAVELLAARESLRLGYKLLVSLRCCLLGLSYPPGEGQQAARGGRHGRVGRLWPGSAWVCTPGPHSGHATPVLTRLRTNSPCPAPPLTRHRRGASRAAAECKGAGAGLLAVQHRTVRWAGAWGVAQHALAALPARPRCHRGPPVHGGAPWEWADG